jgi:hypothetical protein
MMTDIVILIQREKPCNSSMRIIKAPVDKCPTCFICNNDYGNLVNRELIRCIVIFFKLLELCS